MLSYDTARGEDGHGGSAARGQDSACEQAFAYHLKRMFKRPTLGVDLVSHCNLNCACCFHYSPIAEPEFLSADDFERDLAHLGGIEGAEEFFEAICLMGGEPLLHPRLADLVRLTRRHLPRITIRLVTNGLLLEEASSALWETLWETGTEIMVTPYPTGVDYDELVRRARTRGIRAVLGGGLAVSDEGEGFFLKRPLDPTGSQNPTEAFLECPLAGSTMQLLEGRIYPCDRGALFGKLNERFGTTFWHEPNDYLELVAISSAQEIDDFRRTKKPMCRYCTRGLTKRVAWGPSSRSADEWIVGSGEELAGSSEQ
ncbi:MAG: radical SAM protein [Coriobacteriales bacterium]|nr:radical SAM protein [Coriobacteriales bacterium]